MLIVQQLKKCFVGPSRSFNFFFAEIFPECHGTFFIFFLYFLPEGEREAELYKCSSANC